MTSLRNDARRVLDARRERAATAAVPIAGPVFSTVVVAAVVAAVLLVTGAGPAVASVAVAIIVLLAAFAARRTTASLLAGVTLWLVRPYRSGERVRLYLPEHHDIVDAEIVGIGLLNTTLVAASGVFVVANTRLLRTAPECRGR